MLTEALLSSSSYGDELEEARDAERGGEGEESAGKSASAGLSFFCDPNELRNDER